MDNNIAVIAQRNIFGKNFQIYGDIENPLFLAKDVAKWIDYTKNGDGYYDTSAMLRTVDDTEKTTINNRSYLTEDGLYEVLMLSRKPEAKKFKKEVKRILKELRRIGVSATDNFIERTLQDPEWAISIRIELKNERARAKELESEKEVLEIALDQSLRWCSTRRYNIENKCDWTLEQCKSIGKQISAYCRANAIRIEKQHDPLFGEVNSYPMSAWEGFMQGR